MHLSYQPPMVPQYVVFGGFLQSLTVCLCSSGPGSEKVWETLLYQELKFPARGVETNPSSWPWFYRMNEAMEGRLAGAAPLLTPVVEDEDEDCEALSPSPRKRARRSRGGMAEFLTESEMDLLVDNEEKNRCVSLADVQRITDFSYKRESAGFIFRRCLSVCLSAC